MSNVEGRWGPSQTRESRGREVDGGVWVVMLGCPMGRVCLLCGSDLCTLNLLVRWKMSTRTRVHAPTRPPSHRSYSDPPFLSPSFPSVTSDPDGLNGPSHDGWERDDVGPHP